MFGTCEAIESLEIKSFKQQLLRCLQIYVVTERYAKNHTPNEVSTNLWHTIHTLSRTVSWYFLRLVKQNEQMSDEWDAIVRYVYRCTIGEILTIILRMLVPWMRID